ncbi:pilus assembly protein PilP [Bdellovibrio sp. 22V]|uniref:pilus assembly protein PilP n=1 Tax=Bdellovibrio TaxID=958 RepID=UPI002542E115|nr:pilus assembly protein PilP [Bdellovibrio sp. 22V]WII73421.1 pilus assembly protein PilP [Bdellovibrio sp. 22V]
MKSVRWMVSYIVVASLGLWLAFAVSMKFMAPAYSQETPANGDLPPDFMKEVEQTQVPPAGTTPPPAQGTTPPPPTAPPMEGVPPAAQGTQQQVPPPPMDAPIGDAMTAPPPAPVPGIVQQDGYIYDPTGKRDPFKPFRTVRPVAIDPAKPMEKVEPLQRWELDRLQVVGILWDVRTPRAMIRDPDGAVFTVTKNAKIGRAEGYVAVIREGEVVVVETRYDDGKSFKESRVLELKK